MDGMVSFREVMTDLSRRIRQDHGLESKSYNEEAYLLRLCEKENAELGTLKDYDCPVCLNRGFTVRVQEMEIVQVPCSCMKVRRAARKIRKSGLVDVLDSMTFERYIITESWQKGLLQAAERYAKDGEGQWLFIGGQVGCGKTHLCTAVCGELLRNGVPVRYMSWADEAAYLKSVVNVPEYYEPLIRELKEIDVLYIDDLFKTRQNGAPTEADVRLAFEILNHRYIKKLRTLLSTERTMDDLMSIDEGLGSRICQMSREYCLCVPKDQTKNYRMKK